VNANSVVGPLQGSKKWWDYLMVKGLTLVTAQNPQRPSS